MGVIDGNPIGPMPDYGPVGVVPGVGQAPPAPEPVGPVDDSPGPGAPGSGFGPVGPVGPEVFPAAPPTPSSWTVVSSVPGDGSYLTPQEAIDAGHYDLYVKTPFLLNSPILLPNSDCFLRFAPEATITTVGGIPAFKVPDGLTQIRYYQLERPRYESDGVTANQNLIEIADQSGFANVTFHDPYIEYPDVLVNFSGYDTTYTRPHRVTFRGGSILPRVGNTSKLATTPNPGGTYIGATVLSFDEVYLFDDSVSYYNQLWLANFEGDIHTYNTSFGLKEGSEFGGPISFDGILVIGNGDVHMDGTYWSSTATIRSMIVNGAGANSRAIILDSGNIIEPGYMYGVALKFGGLKPCFRDTYFYDSVGLANPGVELSGSGGGVASGGDISGIEFDTANTGHFANGCIQITDSSLNKVHECNFLPTVTGKTILETGTSDKNCIHDNTGVANGTGMTVNINGNDQVHNNIN